MRHPRRITLLALAGAAVLAAGCGSDDEGAPIPQDAASALEAQLATVQARLDNGTLGACEDISQRPDDNNVDAVEDQLNALPDDVDQDTRDALIQGFNRLFELVGERCDKLREDEGAAGNDTETVPEPIITDTETQPDTSTETTPQTDTETETQPDTNTDTTPQTETEPPPTDEGGGAQAPEEDGG